MPRDDARRPAKPKGLKHADVFEHFGQLLPPEDAPQPILSARTRAAVHNWILELGAAPALAEVGLAPRRTAMLSGPPGCGKTTLAHHMAARQGLVLVVVNMAALSGRYLHQAGENVNTIFNAAFEDAERIVLFLDEFDAVGTKRSEGTGSAGDKDMNATVIALLQMIDRFKGTMLAATNRGDMIDHALWRRFGIHLEIGLPDDDARYAIMKRYLAPFILPDDALDELVEVTDGATPALLEQVMNGIKRALVINPRINKPTGVADILAPLLVSVKPPPEVTPPGLWKMDEAELASLDLAGWPPHRPADAEAA